MGRGGSTHAELRLDARRMGRTTPELVRVHLAARSSRSNTSMRRGASGHRPTNQTKQRKAILLQVIEF